MIPICGLIIIEFASRFGDVGNDCLHRGEDRRQKADQLLKYPI